jgi:peroxiredoxin
MIRRWGVPLAIVAAGLLVATWVQSRTGKRTGFPAPDFVLPDLAGHMHRLSDFRGKIVFLNVWATWCSPCRMEMPAMEKLYRRLQSEDFVMLAVSQDEDGRPPVKSLVDQLGLTFPVLIDPQAEVSRRYGVTGYPETFVIDRQGRVIQHVIGPENWESDQSYRYFHGLLQQGGAAHQVRVPQRPSNG